MFPDAVILFRSSEEGDTGGTDDGILRIAADKTEILADGVEKVTFTVRLGTRDVSDESTMNLVLVKQSGEEKLDYGVRAFSTSVAGSYTFKARYYEGGAMYSENEITVTAKPVTGGAVITVKCWACSSRRSDARLARCLALP